MDPMIIGIIGVVLLLALMALKVPIYACFALVGFVGYSLIKGWEFALPLMGIIPYTWASDYVLITVPTFILMGLFAAQSGLVKDLYNAAYKWFGGLPGGLATATLYAAALFGACTGSSVASTATMGTISLPEMRRHNYSNKLATGVICAGGTLAIMIPPSTNFIIYGIVTETSIGQLFISGILPGIMLTIMGSIMIYIKCKINPALGAPAPVAFSFREKVATLKAILPVFVIFIMVVGGLFVGIFTPTEAGAVGAFLCLLVAIGKKRLTWGATKESLLEAARITTMIMAIIMCAMIYNNFVTISGLSAGVSKYVAGLPVSRHVILSIILIIYLILGGFMEVASMQILTLPIFFPLVTEVLGFSPLHFGVLQCLMGEIALITPPVGLNVYVLGGVAKDIPMGEIFAGSFPFVLVFLVGVVILTAFPQITLIIPALAK